MANSTSPLDGSRRHSRVDTSLAAVLHSGGGNAPVRIGNLSPGGAMLEAERLPGTGHAVRIVRGRLSAKGAVVWCSGGRCGVEFATEMALDEWVAPASNAGQRLVDELVSLFKIGGLATQAPARRPDPATPTAQECQLGSDLRLVFRLLNELSDDLAGSPVTVRRHGAELEHLGFALAMLSDSQPARICGRPLADLIGAVFQRLVDAEDELTSDMETVARHGFTLQNLDLAMQMLTEISVETMFGREADFSGNARLASLRVACGKALQAGPVLSVP